MVPIGPVLIIVAFVLLAVSFPLLFQFVIIRATSGKILAIILSKGKDLQFKLLKKLDGEFVKDGKDQWLLDTKQQRLVPYPIVFGPLKVLLQAFQQIVPCSIYMRGNQTPLDWESPQTASLMSSKELAAILDPHWLVALVSGVEAGVAGGQLPKNMKMMLFLAVGASVLCLLMIFVVMYKLSALEQALSSIQNALKVLPVK